MFVCGVVPAAVLFVLAWFLPESPRWLMLRGHTEKAHSILKRIHGKEEADKELTELQEVINLEKNTSKAKLQKGFSKVLLLGVLVSILTQAVGINAIIYYAPTIFKLTGFSHTAGALLATLGVGVVNVVFTILAIRLLDAYGRRPLLLVGVAGIVVSLVIMVVAFASGVHHHAALAWLTFFAVILFIACQAIGTGPACWLIPSEIFPTNMRGLGMGLSVACNWGTNVVVAFLFPVILSHWGGLTSFAIFLVIAIIAFLYFYRYVPETKGVTLEHIEENLYAGAKTRDLGK
jgi:sugar porter (SP) family MFS transporter